MALNFPLTNFNNNFCFPEINQLHCLMLKHILSPGVGGSGGGSPHPRSAKLTHKNLNANNASQNMEVSEFYQQFIGEV